MGRSKKGEDPGVSGYELLRPPSGGLIKRWTRGVTVEAVAQRQLENIASLAFVRPWVAAMPDVHWGLGATVGSVIPTVGAVIPAAVGVDIGCGMAAVRTSLRASDLPDHLGPVRSAIERAIPHGRTHNGRRGDRGAWHDVPAAVATAWNDLRGRFESISEKHPRIAQSNHVTHLGTLGTGNHFIEICLDEQDRVWVMLHSGSRGVGNRIGTYFIELAKNDMGRLLGDLPDRDLAYFSDGTQHFSDYCDAVSWAQDFARTNRSIMVSAVMKALSDSPEIRPFTLEETVVDCHHNYVVRERHFGMNVLVTRKGAVRAGVGELGIIPGSMGTRSFIVRGKGNPESFHSCSHGAGRAMSRSEAKRRFTVEDHRRATQGIECRKDEGVIDETPMAYKPIDAVMKAQADLVDVLHTLRQVVCVKG